MGSYDPSRTAKRVGLGCGLGACGFGGAAIVGFIGLIFYFTMFSNTCAKMLGEETYPIAGDPKQFDAFAEIPEIRKHIGTEAKLEDIDVYYVRSDGTLDLKASYKPAPYANYRFIVPLKSPPENAPPIGAGRGPDDIWTQSVTVRIYEPGQRRHVTRISGGAKTSYSYSNEGMDVDRGSPSMSNPKNALPDPKLTLQEMWKLAMEKGVDKNAVATIEYDRSGYSFSITGLKVRLYWDLDGKFLEDRSDWPGKRN